MEKRIIAAILACLMIWSLTGCQLGSNPLKDAETAINAIGTVNLGSLEIIEYAESLVNAINVPERVKITNKNTLDRARTEYNRLDGLAKEAEAAAAAIGTVTLNSGEAIEKAKAAYALIADYDVIGRLDTTKAILDTAESKLASLEKEAEDLLAKAQGLYDSKRYSEVAPLIAPVIEEYDALGIATEYGTLAVKALCAYSQEEYNRQNYMNAVNLLMEATSYEYYCESGVYAQISKLISDYSVGMNKSVPKHGKILYRTQDAGANYIKVFAGPANTVVKVERLDDPSKYVLVFLEANKSEIIYLLNGNYKLKYTTGPLWIDEQHLFGDFATFVEMDGVAEMAGYSIREGKTSKSYRGSYKAELTQGYGKDFGYQNITPDAF